MCNMSRIRNTLRFQSPEEKLLNGLLAVVLAALLTVAVVKVRTPQADAAAEVQVGQGISLSQETLPRTGGPATSPPTA